MTLFLKTRPAKTGSCISLWEVRCCCLRLDFHCSFLDLSFANLHYNNITTGQQNNQCNLHHCITSATTSLSLYPPTLQRLHHIRKTRTKMAAPKRKATSGEPLQESQVSAHAPLLARPRSDACAEAQQSRAGQHQGHSLSISEGHIRSRSAHD